ncbi:MULTISPECIES: acyltransferase domain-containing protein [unclassified Desulfovibrio]|uniref:acyltransferase domain-containing protein n=1 Tax=unclassified Desulfovibrio TaxID=2593640 RepID=UPI0013EB3EF6|nr:MULTISPECIES: acyltransferase domain-containing protein [unclassified Desulfovibrio]
MPRDEQPSPPDASRDPAAVPGAAQDVALDGVRYARLSQNGAFWRLGSLSPLWREEVAALPPGPDAEALKGLASRGIWLAPETPAQPLAVMCCGLGSFWPGMGRELYDNFPAAREGMDRVAALADWDILGLMDETDMEAIGNTRRQIPYLFLLEYAQWCQFASLGLSPALFCGHSLGELIALSLSGIYGLSEAWYILDTRAEHMAELEASSTRDTGMMAVHAEAAVIDETLAAWPDLYVSNRNTPRQFILSGPREALKEARAALRKRRVPSMVLNVSLAFHHPGMRILRDLSQRRLGALEMHAARVPMLSGITAGYYPGDQPSICRYITDLDENTVAWTDCVDAMWRRDGIRQFLELGPQDTLCGLVADCEPRALCLSAGRKGAEVTAMREACARLYALGHLPLPAIRQVGARLRPAEAGAAPGPAPEPASAPVPQAAPAEPFFGEDAEKARQVLELLAEACGRPAAALRPEQDLRYDLALRSSRFPLLLQEAERRLGVHAEFEDLLQVSTVGDLVRVLLGRKNSPGVPQAGSARRPPRRGTFAPLLRLAPPAGDGAPLPLLPLDPGGSGPGVEAAGVYVLCVLDGELLPELWNGAAAFGATLAVPQGLVADCAPLQKAGSSVLPLAEDALKSSGALAEALDALLAAKGRLDGILFVPAAGALADEDAAPDADLAVALGAWRAGHVGARPWFACLRRFRATREQAEAVRAGGAGAPLSGWIQAMAGAGAAPVLALLDDGRPLGRDALGDRCAAELFRGKGETVLWSVAEEGFRPAHAPLVDRPEISAPVYPEPWAGSQPPLAAESGLFQGGCQFSAFSDPALLQHGGWNLPEGAPWLPFSRALLALLQGARLLLPWLTVTGFSDVRFFAPPALPPGITREGRVTARGRPWIMHDGAMTRMCRTALDIRELTPNGRHTDTFAPFAEAMALLAPGPRPAPPLAPLPVPPGEGGAPLPLPALYARLGLGPDWRLISALAPRTFTADGDVLAVHTGLLAPGTAAAFPIAPQADWGYASALQLTAAVMQGALLVLKAETSAPAPEAAVPAPGWRCEGVGYIRFGLPGAGPGAAEGARTLEVRRTWDDGARVRFDAQVSGPAGETLLTVHHLEFERPATPRQAGTA